MNIRHYLYRGLLFTSLIISSVSVQAENMIMARVDISFDNAMILIKEKLNDYGYKIAHIQKCDGGLAEFGYKTGMYKSVFFGKFEEMRHLTAKFPELIPYLPLKIAVMQEDDSVIMAALNPDIFTEVFKKKELRVQFWRWESDVRAIFDEITNHEKL